MPPQTAPKTWVATLLDPTVIAWMSWSGFFVTIVGLLFALWGICLTYRQVTLAKKKAALEAAQSASEARAAMMSRLGLATFASAASQVETMKILIGTQPAAARAFFSPFRRAVKESI